MLLAYVFCDAIGSPKGKGVGYALMEVTPTTFSRSAAVEDIDGPATYITRHLFKIDRRSREISPPKLIFLRSRACRGSFIGNRPIFSLIDENS